MKRVEIFGLIFYIPIITVNKFSYIIVILLVVLKKIRIYIIVIKVLLLMKKINMVFWVRYNLKVINIGTYNFIQNQNSI